MAVIDRYLRTLVELSGSDLHLYANRPPCVRVHGVISALANEPPLGSEDILEMLREIMPAHNYEELVGSHDTDFAYELASFGRFRVNGFRDMNGFCTVMRLIPEEIPTFEDLNLPDVMRNFCHLSKGLVVVTGPTGSGKSTTLAALVDYINRNRNEHIISIEDPIEFVHSPYSCIINQREVHRDTVSFATALRAALREDPDIVLVGEIRDLETMEIALETAETGHLVFATLHTNNAATTVERMIDKFPSHRQNQIRSMLSDSLQGVVAQTLCQRIGGGRIAAFEVLVVNTAVAALIREGKTHMLPSIIQTARSEGMQSFGDELTRLASKGIVSAQEAYTRAIDKADIETKFQLAGIDLEFKREAEAESYRVRLERASRGLERAREVLEVEPKSVEALCSVAWIMATSPFPELRSGKEALRLAERANKLCGGQEAWPLEVLGVAQAEVGSFRRAQDATRKASALYMGDENKAKGAALAVRLNLFQRGAPYRDE